MMRNSPTTARLLRAASLSLLGLGTGAFLPAAAHGGPVLVSRESGLRASGVSAAGEFNLSNGSGDFALFADELATGDPAAAARSVAEQHSQPRLEGASGAFGGAVANGSARAAVDPQAGDAFSSAQSDFDLVFRVEGEPARVRLDFLIGAAGDATAGLKLYDADTLLPALADEVSGDSREYRGEKVLPPGTYGLSVWAFVRGTPQDSTATYSMELSLAAAGEEPPPATPMPLPPGAWAGLAGLLVVAGGVLRTRRGSGALRS